MTNGSRRGRAPALALTLALVLGTLPTLCAAHGADDGEGFTSGLLHPVFGFDHLLAMVSVGIVSAQLGGASLWRVPLAFVIAMALGGVLGALQLPLPLREAGIAVSVVVLGIAVLVVQRHGRWHWIFLCVLFFGLCHGHAHGAEMPRSVSPAFYTFGFLTSTALLHAAGLLLGELALRRHRAWKLLRCSGAAMALVGLGLLIRGVQA